MKYIMFQELRLKRKTPIIFPDTMVHKQVAQAVLPLMPKGTKVISAGEVNLYGVCGGESETLKMKSRGPKDTIIINTYRYTFGMLP